MESSSAIRTFTIKALVFKVSHDPEFLLSTCNRILHLSGWPIVDDLPLGGPMRRDLEVALERRRNGTLIQTHRPRTAHFNLPFWALLQCFPTDSGSSLMRYTMVRYMRSRPQAYGRVVFICGLWASAAVMALGPRSEAQRFMTAVVMLSYMAQKFVVLGSLGVSFSKPASMQDLLAALQSMGAPQAFSFHARSFWRFSQLYAGRLASHGKL